MTTTPRLQQSSSARRIWLPWYSVHVFVIHTVVLELLLIHVTDVQTQEEIAAAVKGMRGDENYMARSYHGNGKPVPVASYMPDDDDEKK